eukprot:4069733-Pyramimonas_sp.AAC.1
MAVAPPSSQGAKRAGLAEQVLFQDRAVVQFVKASRRSPPLWSPQTSCAQAVGRAFGRTSP